MMATSVTAFALFGANILPALALMGRRLEAIPVSALLTAIVCSLAGMTSLAAGGSVMVWAAWLTFAVNLASLIALRKVGLSAPALERVLPKVVILGVSLLPLTALRRPVIDWDARSIWSFHGRWFYAGGDYLRDAMANPAFAFSHSDYPPAVPATIGTVWHLTGGIDPRIGQLVVGLLTLSAVLLIGLALAELGLKQNTGLRAVIGGSAVLGSFGIAANFGMNGYVDLLWSACIAASVLYLLVSPTDTTNLVTGLVAVVVAGLVKNEGMVAALLVLILAAFRYRPPDRRSALFAAAGVSILAWLPLSRHFGAGSDLVLGLGDVLTGRTEIGPRLAPIAEAVGRDTLLLIATAAAMSLVGSAILSPTRELMGIGSSVWTWAAIAGCATAIGGAYLITPNDLEWHLNSSIERTTISLRLLALIEILRWAVISLERLIPSPHASSPASISTPDRRAVPVEFPAPTASPNPPN